MAHDQHETASGFNVARYFVEHRHISWVLFVGVLACGVGAYHALPKRKDPDIRVRHVAVVTPWPRQSADSGEQFVTRKIEEKIDPGSVNIVLCGTGALDHSFLHEAAELMSRQIRAQLQITPILANGNGFVLLTGIPAGADLPRAIARLWDGLPQRADLHPDV